MSFAGIKQFDRNLRTLMDSKAFKEADEGERLRMGGMLLRSKYGLGSFGGFGKTHELKPGDKEHNKRVSRMGQVSVLILIAVVFIAGWGWGQWYAEWKTREERGGRLSVSMPMNPDDAAATFGLLKELLDKVRRNKEAAADGMDE